ncbi:MAG TPA: serine hydrolase domain-containing protein, partial [Cyclobacteriaceae bacterium]
MMKSSLILLMILNGYYMFSQGLTIATCKEFHSTSTYLKEKDIQVELDQITREGIPGVSMAIYSEEGWWTASSGYAKIEGEVLMQSCHLHYLQSISKTYMSIGILKLYEQGKIDLEAAMTKYLPEKYSRYISDADKITVRMLLNHTSGIPEYNQIPA